MSKPYVKIDSSKTGAVQSVSVKIHFDKEDSQSQSLFQIFGKAYLMLDALTAFRPDRPDIAQTYFLNALIQSGWDLDIVQSMLVQVDWTDRMCSAWYWLDETERTHAATLDYDVYQNFWPSFEFCAPGFDAEAMDWLYLLSKGELDVNAPPLETRLH
ncbi:hypothetical protein BW687_002190 [Pseudomonas graminis]|uniref:hypothetical protein n=1 Tax=Pseudomonas graminis TaxID=158627 RepID=UPI00234BEB68|nr:hypothetical protein [Pseudomonas graminis]MDC6378984.1 hypothetical protein [Pseudomonas graminis]